MSFASKVLYTGDGVTTDFTVTMPYISQSHISVFVNEILQLTSMNYNWSGPSTIQFVYAPGIDDAIEIKRWTSPADILVDFVDGSTLRATDLDTAYLHNYYLGQEYSDSFNEVINEMLVRVATSQGVQETEPAEIIAALVEDMLNSANAANLQARITDIDANAEAIIELGNGLQVQINTLASGVAAAVWIQDEPPVPGVGGIPNPIPEGSRWYDSDDNNHPYIYQSSAWFSIDDPRIGNAEAEIDVLQVDYGNLYSAIVNESFVRATETTSLAQTMALVGSQSPDGQAFVINLDSAFVGPAESLAQRFTQISADWGAGDTAVSAEVTTEASARSDADTAIATTMSLIGAENGAKTAFILDEDTVKIASDGGDTFAERMSALTAADGANAASITTIQTITIPGVQSDADAAQATANTAQSNLNDFESEVQAEYGVDIDVNGYVTGFRIINGGTPGASAFVIRSDNFAIVDTTGGTLTEYVPFEISGGKINMRADVKIDGDLMVTGTINGSALINGTLGSTQIGANAITTTQLNANAVTAVKITANAVTADKINVANLAAINADIGSITAGNITLNTTGYIKGGQTAYDTGTGFFMGYESGAYKFSIGNATDFITWDGTSLIVRGNVSVGQYDASTTTQMLTANTERSSNDSWSWNEIKKFEINRPGTARVYYDGKMQSTTGGVVTAAQSRVKLDGVVKDTENWTSTSYATRNYLLTLGETATFITIEVKSGERDPTEPVDSPCKIKNVSIRADKSDGETVITD